MGTLFLVDEKCGAIIAGRTNPETGGGAESFIPGLRLPPLLRLPVKVVIFRPMHFSRHISQSHSTFSLLAALKLRSRAY
jgi:hypothetical protein